MQEILRLQSILRFSFIKKLSLRNQCALLVAMTVFCFCVWNTENGAPRSSRPTRAQWHAIIDGALQGRGLPLPAAAPRSRGKNACFRTAGSFVGSPYSKRKQGTILCPAFFWSRVRESNPPPRLGKPMYYRCTNPARYSYYISRGGKKQSRFCRPAEELFFSFRALSCFLLSRMLSFFAEHTGKGCPIYENI